MNSNKVIHLDERQCRACMTKQGNLFDIDGILSEETPNLQIFETLAAVVPQLMVQLNDGLPEQICGACLNKLQISYQFQQTCIASQKCLRGTVNRKQQSCNIIKVEPPDLNTVDPLAHFIDIKAESESHENEFISFPNNTRRCNIPKAVISPQVSHSANSFEESDTQSTPAATKRKRRVFWSEAAELNVIELWKQNVMQLKGGRKSLMKTCLYEDMSRKLKLNGHVKSAIEIRFKIRNMRRIYGEEKKKIESSGGTPSTWKFFHKVQEIVEYLKQCKDEGTTTDPKSPKQTDNELLDCSDNCSESSIPISSSFEESTKTN